MSPLFFNNQVIVYLFSEIVLGVLTLYLFLLTIKFLRYWNFKSFSNLQLQLEKKAYLVSTIATSLFALKLTLLIYFVYTIDALSLIVPGAMCAAGVISANGYGMDLLLVKLIIIFTLLLFLVQNSYDLKAKDYPLFRLKSWTLVVAALLIFLEGYLDYNYFTHIDISTPVSCCSSLYGNLEGANPLPFGLNITTLLLLFFTLYIGVEIALFLESRVIVALSIILFGIIAYYSVVYFFGTYVYELPTHKCPFCMLQKEYCYVGYFIWGSLFFGLYFGLIWVIMSYSGYKIERAKRFSMLILTLFVLLCSLYVAVYYIKNGVLL